MKLNKKLLFNIHGWIGIKLSILFFIVCFSGTLATVSHELDWIFNPAMRVTPSGTYASKNDIVENIRKAYPQGKLVTIQATPEPYLCDLAYVTVDGQRLYVFINQYTGRVQGAANLTIQRYMRDLHYYLFIPFQVGHFTVLIFGFMLFISTVTALLFYKKWWKKLFEFKKGKGQVFIFRSLHRLVGLWSVPFTILFSVTGIWYFMERTNTASISDTANPSMPEIAQISLDSVEFAQIHYTLDYDRAVQQAQKAIPGLAVKDILIPGDKTTPIYFTGTANVPLVRNRANRVYIHPITYEVVGYQDAKALPTVTWLNDIADPLHFGYFGGLITKIIWFIGGLGISFLVGTGIWISLKRKIKDARKARAQQLGKWKYANLLVVVLMFGFMFYVLVTRYAVSAWQIAIITASWVFIVYLGWLVYIKRLRKSMIGSKT